MGPSANTSLPISAVLQSHTVNGLPFYTFRCLSSFTELEHAVFTRLGGVSSPPFSSLNLSYDTGDEASKVEENLRRIRGTTGTSSLIYARQSHSSNIVVLHEYPRLNPALPYPLEGKDGFITQLPGLTMMVKVADCQAVFLYDANKRVAAVIHVGWRGSVENILGVAVPLMTTHFHCRPADIIAAIGPSLGPCCAEFRHWRKELPPSFSRFQRTMNHFDFWGISQHQLRVAGLLPENIEVAGLCTKCHPEVFYSYRGEGVTGRFAATIALRS